MNKLLFSLPASFETYQGLGNFMCKHGMNRQMFDPAERLYETSIGERAISPMLKGASCGMKAVASRRPSL